MVGTTRAIRNDKYGRPARLLQGGTTRAIRNDTYGPARLLGGITGVKDAERTALTPGEESLDFRRKGAIFLRD
jgi:hypothetical protein